MLFMYINTHSVDRCMIDKPAELGKMSADMQAAATKAGVKIIAMYPAPHQHVVFAIVEGNDLASIELVLKPMTLWGDGELIPIMPLQELVQKKL